MSLFTIIQMHTDLGKLAPKNAQQLVEPSMLTLFNANLADAKTQHPDDSIIAAISNAAGEVKLGDLLVRVGQLMSALQGHETMLLAEG